MLERLGRGFELLPTIDEVLWKITCSPVLRVQHRNVGLGLSVCLSKCFLGFLGLVFFFSCVCKAVEAGVKVITLIVSHLLTVLLAFSFLFY